MRIELKGLLAGLIAALVVLGAVFGVSAIVSSRLNGKDDVSPSAALMNSSMKRMDVSMKSTASLQMVSTGHTFFTQSCASCHGASGGGGFGPSLHHEDLDDAAISLKIKNGIKPRMPAFGGKYNDQQTQALVAYIRSLK